MDNVVSFKQFQVKRFSGRSLPVLNPSSKPKPQEHHDNIYNLALLNGVMRGNVAQIKTAITAGADINAKDHSQLTGLMIAAGQGNVEITKLLLNAGADKEIKNYMGGDTALMIAVINGQQETVKLLLESGANPDQQDKEGLTCLSFATCRNNREITQLLLEKGANPNLKSHKNLTPLMYAAMYGYTEIIHLLLANGADTSIQHLSQKTKDPSQAFYENQTALHLALEYDQPEAALALITPGNHLTLKNLNEETPLELATKKGYEEIANALRVQLGLKIPLEKPSILSRFISRFRQRIGRSKQPV